MGLRIFTGTCGQGKTTAMMDEIIRLSQADPERQFTMIVPEQFSLEMQRKMIERHPKKGYFNIDVLSFYRLSYRIFEECGYEPRDVLEDLGVSLVLKKILSGHEEEFPFFQKSMKKPGFVDELKSCLLEFICYGVDFRELGEVAGSEALKGHPSLAGKCAELSKIFSLFAEEIRDRYMVAEQILDAALPWIPKAGMLKDGVFYFDGFTGFTPVQLDFLQALLKEAGQVNVSVTMPEPARGGAQEELFYFSKKTWDALLSLCARGRIPVEEPVHIKNDPAPRYAASPELAFLEQNIFRREGKRWEKPCACLHITECGNPEQEAEYVLHKIEELVRREGRRYRDFAVLTGNMERYASAFSRRAGQLAIPLFEDTKKKISYHPGVEGVRALFYLAQSDYSYESVFRYLKSGLSGLSGEETDDLERYVLSAGIRGYGMWKKPFERRMRRLGEEKAGTINLLRSRVMEETEAFFLGMRDKERTVRDKMGVFYETLCRLSFDEKMEALADEACAREDFVREREDRELFRLLLALMDKLVALFGEEKLPLAELSGMMDAGLDALKAGTAPLSMDQVILGDLKRTRLPEVSVLFLVGANEGELPPTPADGGMISNDEKELLSECGIDLSMNLTEQNLENEFYLYLALARPSAALYFTYSLSENDGSALRPSPFLAQCRALFPALPVRRYPEEERRYFNEADGREFLTGCLRRMKQEGRTLPQSRADRMLLRYWYDEDRLRGELEEYWAQTHPAREEARLPSALTQALFGREMRTSITRLERYAACPCQYYLLYGLGLTERDEYAIRPVDFGNICHAALCRFSEAVKESEYNWKTLPDELEEAFVEKAVDGALDDICRDILASSARNRYKLRTITRIVKRTVKILRAQLAGSAFEPDRFELSFGRMQKLSAAEIPLRQGVSMYLEGVIDRVDVCEKEGRVCLRVIDYKTGSKSFSLTDLYDGLQLQLILYLNAAREMYEKETGKETVPAGMYYYRLKDPLLKEKDGPEPEEKRLKNFRMSGCTNDDPEILSLLEAGGTDFCSVKIRLTKGGTPYRGSEVVSGETFRQIGAYAEAKAARLGEGIYDGDIAVRPYRNARGTACDYCPYPSVCGFDERDGSCKFRELPRRAPEELDWEKC